MMNLLVLLGLLATPGAIAQTDGEIPRLDLGLVLPLTGDQAPFGKEAQRGIDLAVRLFQQKDPKLGQRVMLVTADSRSLLSEVGPAASKLLTKDRCQILVGGITSPEAELLASEAAKADSALIVPIASELSPSHSKIVTILALGDAAQGRLLGRFAALQNLKTVAILRDSDLAATTLSEHFTTQLKAEGGRVLTDASLDPASTDYGKTLGRFAKLKAQAILLAIAPDKALEIIKQAASAKLDLVFLGGELWDTPALAQSLREIGAHTFHLAAFAADDIAPETRVFVSAFEAQYKRKPGGIAALAFDAASLAIAAYARHPTAARAQLLASLQGIGEFAGVTGTVRGDLTTGIKTKSGIIKQVSVDGARFAQRVTLP